MTNRANSNFPMRWRDYMLFRGSEFSSFWESHISTRHLSERQRSILFVLGKGFDPRTCTAFGILSDIAGTALTEVMVLEYVEEEGASNQVLLEKVELEWKELQELVANNDLITIHKIVFRSEDGRRVGSRNAANLFSDEARLAPFTDIVVDISAMPRSIFFPIIARLLYFHDVIKEKRTNAPNIHVVVSEDPELDFHIREEGVDETASFLHPFEGEFNREATGQQRKVWIPVLGEWRATQFDRIYDLVKPDEVCPILPSPSLNPRRGDDILMQYRELLFDQLRLDPRNIIYSSEYNPFEVYRQIRKTALQYYEVLAIIGGCKIALSALCSKLMSLGVLLVGYEFKTADRLGIGVAHIECHGYEIDSFVPNPVPVGVWLAGEGYRY